MKKRIIGIILVLFVSITVVSATPVTIKASHQMSASLVDVPIWVVGDSWTYQEQYSNHGYSKTGVLLNVWYHNCTSTYEVTDATGDTYTVKMTSTDNEGYQLWRWLQWKYTPRAKLTGEFILRKNNLASIRYFHMEKGLVFYGIGKIRPFFPGQFYDKWTVYYSPYCVVLPFPLMAGTNGTLANFSWEVHENSSFFGFIPGLCDNEYPPGYSGIQNYTCDIANLSVPAGTYETYNVTIGYTGSKGCTSVSSYYSPEVGWYVEHSYNYESIIGRPGYSYKCQVVSTTYTP